MLSYVQGANEAGKLKLPAGYAFRLEAFQGAGYPVVALPNDQRGSALDVYDDRVFLPGQFDYLTVEGSTHGDLWLVTIATEPGERIPESSGRLARPVKLFEVTFTGDVADGPWELHNVPNNSARRYFDLTPYSRLYWEVNMGVLTNPNTAAFELWRSQSGDDRDAEVLPMGSLNNHGATDKVGWLQVAPETGLGDAVGDRTASYTRGFLGKCAFVMTASGLLVLGTNVLRTTAWGFP